MEVVPGSKQNMSDPSSPGPAYIFFRIVNTIILIAMMGIFAQVMTDYNHSGVGTPSAVMFLFITGIIGAIWSFLVLITFLRANNVNYTIVFLDIVGMILMIVGVALLTPLAYDQCAVAKANPSANNAIYRAGNGNPTQICNLMRAGWGLAIANIVLFFLVAIGGYQIVSIIADEYRRLGGPVARRTVIEEGYPVRPATRNVTQTTTAAVPVGGYPPAEAVVLEKRRRSKSKDHKHRHSSSKDKKRRSSRSERETDVYVERRKSRGRE